MFYMCQIDKLEPDNRLTFEVLYTVNLNALAYQKVSEAIFSRNTISTFQTCILLSSCKIYSRYLCIQGRRCGQIEKQHRMDNQLWKDDSSPCRNYVFSALFFLYRNTIKEKNHKIYYILKVLTTNVILNRTELHLWMVVTAVICAILLYIMIILILYQVKR